jgi:hypothetical protein
MFSAQLTAGARNNDGVVNWKVTETVAVVYPRTSSGWWLTYPSEKNESQLALFFPIYGK